MGNRTTRLKALILLSILSVPGVGAAEEQLVLSASSAYSNDGKATISWRSPAEAYVNIQQDHAKEFDTPSTLYRGKDSATVVTGLIDGDYYFRGRLEYADGRRSNWSQPLNIRVEHHSLARAFGFFSVGLVVFLATLLLIILGARRQGADA
jgi:hypothetical protein